MRPFQRKTGTDLFSRKLRNEWIDDVLYFNAGGAGPRRYTLPITVGRLEVTEDRVAGEIIELPV
ncbi:hypothetical protein [Marinobacter caseinilyticus]|uniref:hypothetical protein n=1 Tax=Marinobacter caseinilyticus TaxID=2692195 RepID=UPI001F453D11|nr:hypothetical protein [Marinobacter caseinilyticus]